MRRAAGAFGLLPARDTLERASSLLPDIGRFERVEELQRVTAATVDVLRVLVGSGEPVWGLRVIKGSSRAAGTVYPVLDRLEESGWVRSWWEVDEDRSGPRRRYYEFTADGAAAAVRVIAKFDARAGRTALRPAGEGL